MDVRALASLRSSARVGFVVPKYKHSAVDRNRLKRRLRELVRVELLPHLRPMDVVFRAAPKAYSCDFAALRAEMQHAARLLAAATLPTPRDVRARAPRSGQSPPNDTPDPTVS